MIVSPLVDRMKNYDNIFLNFVFIIINVQIITEL